MGLSALTRKGWQTNPREQGRWNLYSSILGIVVGTIINLLMGESILDTTYFVVMGLFLLWGIVSFFMGLWLGYLQDKTKNKQ